MENNKQKITKKFLIELFKIKDIKIFLGVCGLLGTKIDNEDKTPKPFHEVIETLCKKFESKPLNKRKELISIIKKANSYKGDVINVESTKNRIAGTENV